MSYSLVRSLDFLRICRRHASQQVDEKVAETNLLVVTSHSFSLYTCPDLPAGQNYIFIYLVWSKYILFFVIQWTYILSSMFNKLHAGVTVGIEFILVTRFGQRTFLSQISRKCQISNWDGVCIDVIKPNGFFFLLKAVSTSRRRKSLLFHEFWEKFRFIWTLLTFLLFRKLKASFLLNMQPIFKLPSKRRKVV